MRKNRILIFFIFAIFSGFKIAIAQEFSEMNVKYMLSFDSTKNVYMAWVVPSYSTPNIYNPDTEEKGVTAQFTLRVPRGTNITELRNLKGSWETNSSKIGNSEYIKGLEQAYEYYVIGKAPNETNYGNFLENEPVALFTFKASNISNNSKIVVVENNDKAVKYLNDNYALNIASSFYSRSGQRATMNAKPLEQFQSETTLSEILRANINKINEQFSLGSGEIDIKNKMVSYPNPAQDKINVKVLVTESAEKMKIELVNINGKIVKTKMVDAKLGFNTTSLDVQDLTDGTYILKTQAGRQVMTTKVIKR